MPEIRKLQVSIPIIERELIVGNAVQTHQIKAFFKKYPKICTPFINFFHFSLKNQF